MFHHYLFSSIFLTIFFVQISYLHSTSINSGNNNNNHFLHENDDTQRIQMTLLYLIKNVLDEPNPSEQTTLLNQLREYLNRMCTAGYLGSSSAHACQHIVDIVNHYDENKETYMNDDSNTEHHGIQKRFFCNGFIGCKNAGR